MTCYIFSLNDKISGVFTDKNILKKKIFKHILTFSKDTSSKEIFETHREKLVKLYECNGENIELYENNWKILTFQINTLQKKYETKFNKLIVKCKNTNIKDLNKKITSLKLSPLYNI